MMSKINYLIPQEVPDHDFIITLLTDLGRHHMHLLGISLRSIHRLIHLPRVDRGEGLLGLTVIQPDEVVIILDLSQDCAELRVLGKLFCRGK